MIIGQRIRLRRVDPQRDLDDRHRWMNDSEVLRWLGTRGAPLSRADVLSYLEICAKSAQDLIEFAIETHEGRHIGGTTLRGIDRIVRQAEFAIVIGEAEYRGKGYGTEVAGLMVEFAFMTMNLNKVWLTVNVENIAGQKAYEKAGFRLEGTLRDHTYAHGRYFDAHRMGVLRREWEEAHSGDR